MANALVNAAMVKISVVVVTFNSSGVISDCLSPIYNQDGVEIIVYDNASSDSTVDIITRNFGNCRLIEGRENLGFAKAVNRAAAWACADYLVLLNPDAITSVVDLRRLCVVVNDDSVGIAGPRIEHPAGRLKIMSAGRFPTVWRMATHYTGLSRLRSLSRTLEGHYLLLSDKLENEVSTDWVTGACLVTSLQTFQRLGGLSERWFMYAEDIDFCHRVKAAGQSVILCCDVLVSHAIGTSDASKSYSANPAWVINLFELFDRTECRNRAHFALWGVTVALGLASRSAMYRARYVLAHRASNAWIAESARFQGFSVAVARRAIQPRFVSERIGADAA